MRRLLGILYLAAWKTRRALWGRLSPRASTPPPEPAGAANKSAARYSVLVVSPYSIHPLIHGGAVRIGNLIQKMSAWCDVSAFIFIGGTDDPGQREALEPWCDRVFFQQAPAPSESAPDPWGLLPPSATSFASTDVSRRLAALVDAHDFDVVHLEFTEMGYYMGACGPARTILTELDLSFTSHLRQREIGIGERFDAVDRIGAGSADALRQDWFEVTACERADQIHVMSKVDGDLLAAHLGDGRKRIRVVPNGVNTEYFTPPPAIERRHVLFLGSFPHLPNLDAFEFLTDEVWPAIRELIPDARISVAGARPPDSVLAWDGRDGITVVGEVSDVAPLYHSHRVLVVPLRAGSGTRLKILEALAAGLPVVSTGLGAEGLALSEPPEVQIADTIEEISEAVVDLLRAPDDRIADIGARGRDLARTRYDWKSISETLRTAHSQLLSERPARRTAVSVGGGKSDDSASPELSIIIPTSTTHPNLAACLERIGSQQFSKPYEILCVDWGSTVDEIAKMRESGARVISKGAEPYDQGATVNAGGKAARGKILIFVSQNVVPSDDHWLESLTAPFEHDRPPSAVQGGVHGQLSPCAPFSDPNIARETHRWVESQGGFAFSMVNAAIRRDVWEDFPFHPGPIFEDRSWQRIVRANGHLVLPCWAAAVRYVRPFEALDLLRLSIAEGRGWRLLGVRCGLRFASGAAAIHGRSGPLRLLGMFLGNHRLAPWPGAFGPV